ncbi:hypothetical protein [Microbacterium elymi]|uniref:Uncharacterized protein n=1 Tax=Microbacterium elymi TaxID=2909587 RepID=A0ABY5NIT4_9MICO|nr:hypothetical protein [Microbacterium elymi]UUT35024.1 hypothetical protein L2X98_32400 [Microbacterium elymi]
MRTIMSASAAAPEVSRLRARLEQMQGRRLDAPVLPTLPALAELARGGLRPGAAYAVGPSASRCWR